MKTASDGADATRRGRLFQTVAPKTGNARLPVHVCHWLKLSISVDFCIGKCFSSDYKILMTLARRSLQPDAIAYVW